MKKETKAYLDGGKVNGPGTETSDSIPARLSNGEFVIKAKVVKQPGVLEFLRKLNNEELTPLKLNEGGLADKIRSIGQDFSKFVNEGKVRQIRDSEQTPNIVDNRVAGLNTSLASKNEISAQTIIPEVNLPVEPQDNSAPIVGVNKTVLQERYARIEAEQDPLKKALMQRQLLEQLRNLQGQDSGSVAGYKDGGEVQYFNNGGGPVQAFQWGKYEDPEPQESEFQWGKYEDTVPQRTLASLAEEEALNQQNKPSNVDPGMLGAVEAGAHGLTKGLTYNLADEMAAPVMAAASMASDIPSLIKKGKSSLKEKLGGIDIIEPLLPDKILHELDAVPSLPDESTLEKYKRLTGLALDTVREREADLKKEHGNVFTTGEVTGSLLAPGLGAGKLLNAVKGAGIVKKIGTGTAVGAGMSGLSVLGEAEGSLKERLPEAIEGTQTGAAVGGALPVAGGLLKLGGAAIGKIADIPFIKNRIDQFVGGLAKKDLYTEKGRKVAAQKIYNISEDVYNKIENTKDNVGKAIKARLEEAEKKGVTIDISEEITKAEAQSDEILKTDPSTDTVSRIKDIKSEFRALFGIKPEAKTFEGVPLKDVPEGLIIPKEAPVNYNVTPTKARELKQTMFKFTPGAVKGPMDPALVRPGKVASDIYNEIGEKLQSALDEPITQGLNNNQKYSLIKDTITQLLKKESKFENVDKEKINNILTNLDLPTNSSDKADRLYDQTIAELQDLIPGFNEQFKEKIVQASKDLKLVSNVINKGNFFTRGFDAGANLTGQGLRSVADTTKATNAISFTKEILKKPMAQEVFNTSNINKAVPRSEDVNQAAEPLVNSTRELINQEPLNGKDYYKRNKLLVKAIENASPEFLKQQAQQIREQHGKQGEQLAQIIESVADTDPQSRHRLAFSVFQNPAYRKMLGAMDNE